ncbi:MAG: hypothetical protein R3F41_06620 [Gammaproteobacteria bacterium]|nr:hypothetical protein [Pseudomonadales bacterium]MCP5348590.1 hypothetical protein [Pseudomonadales bacterium]
MALAVTVGLSSPVIAHTRFEIPVINEGQRVYNNMVIGHGCGENDVYGTSVVFPDGATSSVTVDGEPHAGSLGDFLSNWGNSVQAVYSRALFDATGGKEDNNGNSVGFWAGGNPLPHHLVGLVPFRTSAINFVAESCAVSVRFYVSIVDICQITTAEELTNEGVAGLWTHNNLGTVFDRISSSDDGPAPLTVMRDLEANPLPASCGVDGVAVEVRPSADQINRDMPIRYEGVQAWPIP